MYRCKPLPIFIDKSLFISHNFISNVRYVMTSTQLKLNILQEVAEDETSLNLVLDKLLNVIESNTCLV